MTSFSSELAAELKERERFKEQLQAVDSYNTMDSILSCELDHRSAVANSRKMTLQVVSNSYYSNNSFWSCLVCCTKGWLRAMQCSFVNSVFSSLFICDIADNPLLLFPSKGIACLSNVIIFMYHLQGIIDEQNCVFEELKQLEARAASQLSSERSKNLTLLKALEGAPLKTELSLLKDNQQLILQLRQTEEKVKVCLHTSVSYRFLSYLW